MHREGQRAQAGIGADVGRRLLATDVLLARGQREHEAALAVGIDGLADETPRHLAHILVAGREQADIRTAEAEPVADRLALADHDVGAHLARWHQQPQRHDFRHDHDQQRTGGVAGFRQPGEVADMAEEARVLHDHAGRVAIDRCDQLLEALGIGLRQGGREAFPLGRGLDDAAILRMQAARDQRLVAAGDAVGHQDGLGGAGRAVVHRGVGDLHAGEQRHLGLELEQVLQRALRDLRLIRRVRGQELAALDHVVDGRRHMMAVGAGADEERRARGRQVPGREALEGTLDFELALVIGQAADLGRQPRRRRHVPEQLVDRLGADHAQHLAAIGLGEGEITHQAFAP